MRTRSGGSPGDEATIAYTVTVYVFQGDECRAVQFFGDDIDKANSGEDSRIGKRGPQNLLELLPDEFTTEDAKRVRLQQGLDNSGNRCRNMIYQWISRKYVLQLTVDSFKKTPPVKC